MVLDHALLHSYPTTDCRGGVSCTVREFHIVLRGHRVIVDILEHRGHHESLSAVDGVLRCCSSAGTVQTWPHLRCDVCLEEGEY